MSFLLDTNVIAELRKGARCEARVRAWFEKRTDSELFVSVVALAEIRDGIEQLSSRDPRQATQLEIWLLETQARFGSRVIPVTTEIADRWGRLRMAK